MLYDVTVDRIQTCGKVIRVEADDREAAERKAMAQAQDEDFEGLPTQYDFECCGVFEVSDPSVPANPLRDAIQPDENLDDLAAKEAGMTCSLCGTVMPDMETAVEEGWVPSYFDGEEPCEGPVCNECLEKYLTMDKDGELVLKELKGEYVSEWEAGDEYRSPCAVNIRTRTVEIEQGHDVREEDGMLMREYVVLDGKEYKVADANDRDQYADAEQAQMFFRK